MRDLTDRKSITFSAFTLKIIACAFMMIDHIGAYLLPNIICFRIAGRISFPLFAYFIAEGCAYTRNKLKRLLLLFVPGVLFEAGYIVVFREKYGNIFLTFTLSVILIYALEWIKKEYSRKNKAKTAISSVVFVALLGGAVLVNRVYGVDYGIFGVLVPVFAALFEGSNRRELSLLSFSFGLIVLSFRMGLNNVQVWSLMAVPLLALYNGEAGIRKFKYVFYIFYPLHLIIIWAIGIIMQYV